MHVCVKDREKERKLLMIRASVLVSRPKLLYFPLITRLTDEFFWCRLRRVARFYRLVDLLLLSLFSMLTQKCHHVRNDSGNICYHVYAIQLRLMEMSLVFDHKPEYAGSKRRPHHSSVIDPEGTMDVKVPGHPSNICQDIFTPKLLRLWEFHANHSSSCFGSLLLPSMEPCL